MGRIYLVTHVGEDVRQIVARIDFVVDNQQPPIDFWHGSPRDKRSPFKKGIHAILILFSHHCQLVRYHGLSALRRFAGNSLSCRSQSDCKCRAASCFAGDFQLALVLLDNRSANR